MPLRASRAAAATLLVALVSLVAAGCGEESTDIPPPKPVAKWDRATGQFAGNPRGVLILVHGGSWKGIDRELLRGTRAQASIYNQLGFDTMTIDYRAGADGLEDLERFYKQARKEVGGQMPICAVGSSAGGHLALMLATRAPDLDCAVSLAGPTNLAGLDEQEGGADTYEIASDAFGEDRLEELSPTEHAARIRARVFVAGADNDPLMPAEQLRDIERAVPGAETVLLPAGDSPWVHSSVDPAAKQQMNQLLATFLVQVAPAPVG